VKIRVIRGQNFLDQTSSFKNHGRYGRTRTEVSYFEQKVRIFCAVRGKILLITDFLYNKPITPEELLAILKNDSPGLNCIAGAGPFS
jgi:hypothetical protein